MKPEPANHRPFEHTADTGVEIDAPGREELFAEAAVALCDTMTPVAGVRCAIERQVEVEAGDDELLLVDFLNAVLLMLDTQGLLFGRAVVQLGSSSGSALVHLHATLHGEPYDESRHPLHSLIKAVTYHGLRVWQEDGRFRARVLFDL